MGSIEKLMKALESLRVFTHPDQAPSKKKVEPLTSKDKITHLNTISDSIICPTIRNEAEFASCLSFVIEVFLTFSGDQESDVRMVAEEALNRVVKTLKETHLGRVQVELFKEIKKNGTSRCVRNALSRFALLAHLTRTQKRRAYTVNLLPCINRLTERHEEALQECLQISLTSICPVFMKFATDSEIQAFVTPFLSNVCSTSAVVRRVAASCSTLICQHSRKSEHFLIWLLKHSIDTMLPVLYSKESSDLPIILGSLQTIRCIIPLLTDSQSSNTQQQTSSNNTTSLLELDQQLIILVFELIVHCLLMDNSSITLSALECLNHLLKSDLSIFYNIILHPGIITHSLLAEQYELSVEKKRANARADSGGDTPIDDIEIRSLDSAVQLTLDEGRVDLQLHLNNEEQLELSPAATGGEEAEPNNTAEVEGVVIELSTKEDNSDNILAETTTSVDDDSSDKSTPRCGTDVGSLFSEQIPPIVYCARVVVSSFLMNSEGLYPDREVRVSIKSLSLSCLSTLVKIQPEIFSLHLYISDNEPNNTAGDTSVRMVSDILEYSTHTDPQIQGYMSLLIGNLITSSVNQLMSQHDSDDIGVISPAPLSSYLTTLKRLLMSDSSMTVRLTLQSVRSCLPALLESVYGCEGLALLDSCVKHQFNSYWLVRVELLELLSRIKFTSLVYHSVRQEKTTLTQSDIIDIIINMIADNDYRVRQAASTAVTELVVGLYPHKVESTEALLTHESLQLTSSYVHPITSQLDSHIQPYILGLPQYLNKSRRNTNPTVQANLSQLVNQLSDLLMTTADPNMKLGIITTLAELSQRYPVTQYSHSWSCSSGSSLHDISLLSNKPPLSNNSTLSSIRALDDLKIGSGGGYLLLYISYLTCTPISHDLGVHNEILTLTTNLISGAADSALKHSTQQSSETTDKSWPGLYDRLLVPAADKLFSHFVKLLSIYTNILSDSQGIVTPTTKAVFSAAREAITSPIKKRTTKSEPETEVKTNKDAEKNIKSRRELMGQYNNIPQYVKLYDTIKSAYHNYKATMSLDATDKFTSLLTSVLRSTSLLLEFMTLSELGKCTEELLEYLSVIISVEPTQSIRTLHQMLKCLFGTNLCTQYSDLISSKVIPPGDSRVKPSNETSGVFNTIISEPNIQLNQSISNNALRNEHDNHHNQLYVLKKSLERKQPAVLRTDSKVDKLTISAYIRLFEPLVIRSLKMYTTSSDSKLQCQVLATIIQLIQLKVNYCMLDNDEVFLTFILRQIELISESPYTNTDHLISSTFKLLMLLSYDKLHSKILLTIPRIIQLCDAIMASGDNSDHLTIAALEQIVYDLFLCRRSEQNQQDMEVQREFLLSILLRLIKHEKVLKLLVIILNQSMLENDDKWKRYSRMVMDSLLPKLSQTQVLVGDITSLHTLYQIFLVVSPSVYRPVDLLLKTLLAQPNQNIMVYPELLHRWLSGILSIIRALIHIGKEEVVLSRLNDLDILFDTSHMTSSTDSMISSTYGSTPPQQIMASFLVQVLMFVSMKLYNDIRCTYTRVNTFLIQQISHLLIFINYITQSGHFRKITRHIMDSLQTDQNIIYHHINMINTFMSTIQLYYPSIMMQWCNVLILLNYENKNFWSSVLRHKPYISEDNGLCLSSLNLSLIERGGLVMYCDYVMENIQHAEHLTWLTVNYISDIIKHITERPVNDFLSTVYCNSSASLLLVQAVHSRYEMTSSPNEQLSVLKILKHVHKDQSGPLLSLLVEKLLSSEHLCVRRQSEQVASRRCEMLLADMQESVEKQLSLDEVLRLLRIVDENRYRRLHSLINKISIEHYNNSILEPGADDSTIDITVNKSFYIKLTKYTCDKMNSGNNDRSVSASLLGNLEECDITNIMNDNLFDTSCLKQCIQISVNKSARSDIGTVVTMIPEHSNPNQSDLLKSTEKYLLKYWSSIPTQDQLTQQLSGSLEESSHHTHVDINLVSATYSYLKYNEETVLNKQSLQAVVYMSTNYFSCWSVQSEPTLKSTFTSSYHDVKSTFLNIDHLVIHLRLLSHILNNDSLTLTLCENEDHVNMCIGALTNILNYFGVSSCSEIDKLLHEKGSTEDMNSVLTSRHHQMFKLINIISNPLQQNTTLSNSLTKLLHNVIIGLARLPGVNEYARITLSAYMMSPLTSDHPPEPTADALKDTTVLKESIKLSNLLGWVNRKQFEETWASYLHLLSPLANVDRSIHYEDDIENVEWMVTAFRGIASLLLNTLRRKPNDACILHVGRNKPITVLLSTSLGRSLHQIRLYLSSNMNSTGCECMKHQSLLCKNTERTSCAISYGQLSISHIHTRMLITSPTPHLNLVEQPDTDSSDKQTHLTTPDDQRPDLRSCLKLLTEIYAQLLSPPESAEKTPLILINQCVKSIVELSDLFTDVSQYEWMFKTLYGFYQSYEGEDELINQYLILGLMKSASIYTASHEHEDKLIKLCEQSLKSTHIPTLVSSIHACLYMIESRPGSDVINSLIPSIIEFINKSIELLRYKGSTLSLTHNLSIWSLIFYMIENFKDSIRASDQLINKILEVALFIISDSESQYMTDVINSVLSGLERLILTKSLHQTEIKLLLKTATDSITMSAQNQLLSLFALIVTCIYSDIIESTTPNYQTDQSDNTMELITLVFDWVRKGLPNDVSKITAVLPSLMRDLFSPHDVLNKVIAEFLSEQQPHPTLIAKLIFEVFEQQLVSGQTAILQEWIMLSLVNFTHKHPVSMAIWSLNVFFVCSSDNEWLRALFPLLLSRLGHFEQIDEQLFVASSIDFYKSLNSSPSYKKDFMSAYKNAARTEPIYKRVLQHIDHTDQ